MGPSPWWGNKSILFDSYAMKYILIRHTLQLVKDEKGGSIVEYSLVVILVAIVCIVGVMTIGQWASDGFMNDVLLNAI